MSDKLIPDFKTEKYLRILNQTYDPSGYNFQIFFTGREDIGNNYHLWRNNVDNFMITYTIKGNSHLIYEGKYYNVPKDSLIFIDCRKTHECWSSPEGYSIIYFHIQHPMLENYFNYITKLASPVIHLENDNINFVKLLNKIHKDIDDNLLNREECSKEIYIMLGKLKKHVELNHKNYFQVPEYINVITNYISKNYMNDLTLDICAKVVNMSPNYLENVFSKYTGTSIGKYISNFRLIKAQNLLLNTNKTLCEIAADVGLHESRALIRLFKKYTGHSPLKFKKQNLKH